MKTVNASTSENTTTFFISIDGDIFDTKAEAEDFGIAGKVIVDDFYCGSLQEMRMAALEKFNSA